MQTGQQNFNQEEVYVMTPLRQKMIRTKQLRNLAKETQKNYLLTVKGLA